MIFIISVRYLVPNLFCFTIFPLFSFLSRIIWHKSTWISRFIDIFIYNKCYLLSNANHINNRAKSSCSHLSMIIWYCMCMKLGKYNIDMKEGQLSILSKKYKTEKNAIFSRVKQLNTFWSKSFWLCQRGPTYTSTR